MKHLPAAASPWFLRPSALGALLGLAVCCAQGAEPAAPLAQTPPTRYLLLCLDGVSYSLVKEMYARGELPHFQPPSKLVVAFPTLTDPTLVEILKPLGAPPARGYEAYYFDAKQNRMRGGFRHRFRRKDFVAGTFRELFDYHPHPLVMTAEYAAPVLGSWIAAHLTLGRILKRFERSREPYFLAYLDASDSLSHLSGKRFVRGLLRRIDRNIPRLRQKAGGPVEVIVFSDHGNAMGRYRRAPLQRALKRAGFRVSKRLRGPRRVVLPQYGLVGSAVLYTQAGLEPEVAAALRDAEGVAAVTYREGAALVVENSTGRARILRQDDRYGYFPETGDPLELVTILQQLAAAGELDAAGTARAAAWWQATLEHTYPDPLRRLGDAFGESVAQPANLIVDLKEGYYTGSRLLDFFAGLKATHGNLGREQSVALLLTTGEPFPPVVRGDRLWNQIEERVLTPSRGPVLPTLPLPPEAAFLESWTRPAFAPVCLVC